MTSGNFQSSAPRLNAINSHQALFSFDTPDRLTSPKCVIPQALLSVSLGTFPPILPSVLVLGAFT